MAKVIFFGTPQYIVSILEKLNKFHEVVGVVTQPPKPTGRKQFLTYSPVDDFAHKRKIPIFFDFEDLPEADFGVCAAFGKIIPGSTIESFKHGILNIHPSLLPSYRGASPVTGAIMDGVSETGVSIIKMDSQLDHGPIVAQFKEEIRDDDTAQTLRDRLFDRSGDVLIELVPAFLQKKITLKPQDDKAASFTKTLKKEDGFVEFEKIKDDKKSLENHNFIRALTPWPGAWTEIEIDGVKKRLKLLSSTLRMGKLILNEVQLEGKNPVSFLQFTGAYPEFKF